MSCDASPTAVVTAIQKYCLDDGPGVRTTVFLKGCPLRCEWCHNPETWRAAPEIMQRREKCTLCGACTAVCSRGARSIVSGRLEFDRTVCIACGKCADVCRAGACEVCGREMSVPEVMEDVARDRIFYETSGGGMTVSGGECAARPEFTLALLRTVVSDGISCAIETSGYGDPEFYRAAASLGTLFLYDIKMLDPARHQKLCGTDNRRIMENLRLLFSLGARVILRLPLIPGVNDDDAELYALAEFLSEHRGKYEAAQIMPYHGLGVGKARSLGRDGYDAADGALAADNCASAKPRWREILGDYVMKI